MIYAEFVKQYTYHVIHEELDEYIRDNFSNVKSGLQSDSWFWIYEGDEKVAIDDFTYPKYQIKCSIPNSALVKKVIDVMKIRYEIEVYEKPEFEGHEDEYYI